MLRFRLLRSTGVRFALLHTLVFVISVAVIGWVAELSVTSALERQARQRVEAEAVALAMEDEHEGWEGLRSMLETRLATPKRRLLYAVIDAQGKVTFGDSQLATYAAALPGSGVVTRARGASDTRSDQILVVTRSLADGARLVVADDLESIEDVEDVVSNAFLVALVAALGLGLGSGAILTATLLRKVEAVTQTADAIIAGDLSRRIILSGSGDDFDRLSATLNAMLDRISELMDNLRQVTNDIAHDLRTPLSRLRQGLENARARATEMGHYELAVERAIGEADGLLKTFSALLRIAQIEAGARRAAFRPVDLSEVLQTIAEAYEPVAEDGGRLLRAVIPEQVKVQGDRELLAQLFANLVENALYHTPPGTAVTLALERSGHGGAIAAVADDGPGIPKEEREKVLRRFYRLERSRTTPGNGLGLSLVAAIADLHRATLELGDSEPGLKVVVRFPDPGLAS